MEDDFDVLTGEKIKVGKDLHKLSGIRRAISNFVNITTGDSIPVKFSSGDQSYTDGKSVVISSNIKDKDFDSTVGLALHEGSHIKLTDFSILPELDNIIKKDMKDVITHIKEKYSTNENPMDDWNAVNYISTKLGQLLNIVEDRRIDYHIFKNAPGYKGYYHAMYDKYFNASIIDKALKMGAKNDPTKWDDYLFHIANFANPNRNLGTLPALKDVWNIINLSNIQRLKSTREALQVATTVFKTIEYSIPKPGDCSKPNPKGGNCQKQNPKGGNCSGNGQQSQQPKQGPSGGTPDDGSKTQGTDVVDNTPNLDNTPKGGQQTGGNNTSNTPVNPLSDSQQKSLDRQIEKQNDFQDNNIKKSKLSKADSKKVEAMDMSGSEIKTTGAGEYPTWYGTRNLKGFETVVVNNFNKSLIDSELYDDLFNTGYWGTEQRLQQYQDNVNRGITLGTMLGKKLQVRNESSSLKNSRLNKGKIDKRLIASLGFGSENVFEQTFVTRYNDAHVHLSIDASGSMSGNRFEKATIAAVAIAKAASMIQGLNVVISYRTTTNIGNKYCPCILIAYDSRKDKFSKVKSLFKYIACNGTTPEGLCFEAIQNEIVEGNNNIDSYFINFSDGEPYFCGQGQEYFGEYAITHTKLQVEKMRDRGIKILSYFIDGRDNNEGFKRMYGKDASSVNVSQLLPLAKTLNQMFLDK
jgi:hypothetical protein